MEESEEKSGKEFLGGFDLGQILYVYRKDYLEPYIRKIYFELGTKKRSSFQDYRELAEDAMKTYEASEETKEYMTGKLGKAFSHFDKKIIDRLKKSGFKLKFSKKLNYAAFLPREKTIECHPNAEWENLAHELIHLYETENPKFSAAEKTFFEKRIKFSSIEKYENWGSEYRSFPNRFITKYMGRVYPSVWGEHYETTSCAAHWFYGREQEHRDLLCYDPELYDFFLKTLDGEFEK